MNTWQTVYEQLQEILNKCIELWLNKELFSKWCYVLEDWVYNNKWWRIPIYSYHDLFSKDSWLMEFVEWKEEKDHRWNKKEIAINPDIVWCVADVSYRQKNVEYHYMIMSHLTSEQKIQYFLDNAIIPTK